ncbi:hypothetical protein GCM10023160_11740 [Brachybacterium paraconglomeratum]
MIPVAGVATVPGMVAVTSVRRVIRMTPMTCMSRMVVVVALRSVVVMRIGGGVLSDAGAGTRG